MKTAVLLCLALTFVAACFGANLNGPPEVRDLFLGFMRDFNKHYSSAAEMEERFNIFHANLKQVGILQSTTKRATFGITKFSDLTPEEFAARYLTYRPAPHTLAGHYTPLERSVSLPASFDWQDKGAVTPVKNQGQCGSCWAFSAVEAIESQWFLAGNTLPLLSEQQVVDCDRADYGCNGGYPSLAYKYVMSAGGIESEQSYPYTARDGTCKFNKNGIAATIKNWEYITKSRNETEMAEKLVTTGPQSICVDATIWQFYTGGVITTSDHCNRALNHCVLLTGYNDNHSGHQVWNARNSWGTSWGERGYIYIERGHDLCGIADEVTRPLI